MTQGEKITLSAALSEAWKKRPGYIADIVEKNPKLYNSWRAIRFTAKGKRAGCCEEWKNYRKFYEDVAPSFFGGCVLRRKDIHKPWSPDNFMTTTTAAAAAAQESIFIEYNGERLSLRQWSVRLGIPYNGVKLRYYRHKDYTPEQILFGIRKARGSKVAKDANEPGVKIRAKASKMISQYKAKDRANGCRVCDITIDWMLENILSKPCHYCGDTRRVGCDRIDNKKGHTMDNVVPCCVECNTARNDYFTYEEMRRLGKTIAEIKKDRIQ